MSETPPGYCIQWEDESNTPWIMPEGDSPTPEAAIMAEIYRCRKGQIECVADFNMFLRDIKRLHRLQVEMGLPVTEIPPFGPPGDA